MITVSTQKLWYSTTIKYLLTTRNQVIYIKASFHLYSSGAFAKARGMKTLQAKNKPNLQLGGRILTEKDKLQINLKYCKGPGPKTTTTTKTTATTPRTTKTKRTTRPTNPPTKTRPTKPVTGG